MWVTSYIYFSPRTYNSLSLIDLGFNFFCMMSSKLRPLYLLIGFAGLFYLLFQIVANISNLDLVLVLAVAIPDMFFFYLAYLTYPPETDAESLRQY
jgi:hypothetical protein